MAKNGKELKKESKKEKVVKRVEESEDDFDESDDEAAEMAARMRREIRGEAPFDEEERRGVSHGGVNDHDDESGEEEEEIEDGEDSSRDEEEEEDEEDSEEDSSSDSEEEDDDDEEKERLRNTLAEIPFGVMLEMRRDGTTSQPGMGKERSGGRSEEDEKKRRDKNAPAEMSSKKPVSRYREVVHVGADKRVDPRFERLSGKLNEDLFRKAYGFVNEKRRAEIKDLRKRLPNAKGGKDGAIAINMREELAALESAEQKDRAKQAVSEKHRSRKTVEKRAVQEGKKPFFLKKSDARTLELAKRYEAMGDKGRSKLDDVLTKRRKKNAQKDHRFVPYKRRT